MAVIDDIGNFIKLSWSASQFNDWLWQDYSWINKVWGWVDISLSWVWNDLFLGLNNFTEINYSGRPRGNQRYDYLLFPWWEFCLQMIARPLAFTCALPDNVFVGLARLLQKGFEALGYQPEEPWLNWNLTTQPFEENNTAFSFFGKCGSVLGAMIGCAIAGVTIAAYHVVALGIALAGTVISPVVASIFSVAAIIVKCVASALAVSRLPAIAVTVGLGIPAVAVSLLVNGAEAIWKCFSRCFDHPPVSPAVEPPAPPAANNNRALSSAAVIALSPVGGNVVALPSLDHSPPDGILLPPQTPPPVLNIVPDGEPPNYESFVRSQDPAFNLAMGVSIPLRKGG